LNADWLFALSPLVIALAAVGVIVPVYVRLGRLEGEVTSNRERSNEQFREARERADAQHAETLAEIRRLTDAFLSHSHAPDGGIIFRVPPPSGSTLPE
jgi:hypothetical protein